MAFRQYFTNMGGFWSNASQHGLNSHQIALAPAPRCPTGLVDLPNEILEMICLELGDDGMGTTTRRRDLLHLGRAFKRMHRIVQLVLCRTIVARGRVPTHKPVCRVRLADLVRVAILSVLPLAAPLTPRQIRTIWNDPDLGAAIRHVALDVFGLAPFRNDRNRYLVYGSVYWNKQYIALAVRRVFDRDMAKMRVPSSIPMWCQQSPMPLFLLLAMAPNLTKLELTISRRWNPDPLIKEPPSAGIAAVPYFTLPRLKTLRLTLDEEFDPGVATRMMREMVQTCLATAPNLTSLELRVYPKLIDLPLLTNLKSLTLVNTHLSLPALSTLTTVSPALQRLCTFFYGNNPLRPAASLEADYDGGGLDLIPNRLRLLAHSPLAATLQTVVFSDYMLSDAGVAAMPRLANLTALGVRYMGYQHSHSASPEPLMTLLRDCPSLRALLITGAFRMGRTGLRQFAEAVAAGEFPALRRVTLAARDTYWDKLKRIAREPVPARFKAAGVQLEFALHEEEGTAGLVRDMEEAVRA